MRPHRRSLALLLSAAALSGCGADAWVERFGDAAAQTVSALAVDGAGNTAVAGVLDGVVDFGDDRLSCEDTQCGFVAVLDTHGHPRFGKRITGDVFAPRGLAPAGDGTWLLAARDSGKTVVAGTAVDPFGDGVMLASLDAKGEPRWIRHWSADDGGPTGMGVGDPMAGVAVDAQGNIIMAGMFAGTFGFGGPPIDTALGATPDDLPSAFVVALDPSGGHRWTKALVDPDTQTTAAALAVAPGGDVLVGGWRRLGLGVGYLVRFDSHGTLRDDMPFAGSGMSKVQGIAVDPRGDVVITGQYQGEVTFGDQKLPTSENRRGFVIALSSDDEVRWVQTIDGDRIIQSSAIGVAVDDTGASIVSGTYVGKLADLPVHPGDSAFVAELRPGGEIERVEALSPTEDDSSLAPFVGLAGRERRMAGSFMGTLTTGGETLVSRGGSDVFVSRSAR